MKKRMFFSLLLLISLLIPFINVKAAYVGLACGNDVYRISEVGRVDVGNSSGNYRLTMYNTTNADGSFAGYTYCLNPGLQNPVTIGSGVQQCARRIDPSNPSNPNQAYDIAIQKAYELLMGENLINDSVDSRIIGEMVFRFLSFHFGQSQPCIGEQTCGAKAKFSIGNIDKWNDPRATRAIDIFKAAITDTTIWDPQYEVNATALSVEELSSYKLVTSSGNDDGMVYLKFDVKAKNSPQETFWDKFTVTCANGYQCEIVKPGEPGSSEGYLIVRINTKTGTGDYGVQLNTSYYDPQSASANIMEIYQPGNSKIQHMLIINSGTPTIKMNNGDRSSGGGGVPVTVNACICDETSGVFKDSKTNNTCKVSESSDKCENFKKTYKCVVPASNPTCEQKNNVCKKDGDKCYGPDGKEIPCDKYEELCNYKCTDEYENYCPGDGTTPNKDGKIKTSCSEAEWTKMCLCEREPSNPKCANCNAAVNMVGDCADLTTGNVKTEYTGAISDVNEKDNTGAYIAACRTKDADKDPIKACVAHDLAIDQAGNNYKSTNSCDETNTQTLLNNPYCSVYCKEQYNFTTPTAQLVASGGYFTVYTKISGKRTCYVAGSDNKGESTPINYVQFKKDFDLAQKEVIDAWNEYNHWRTGYEDGDHSRIDEDSEWCDGGDDDDDDYVVTDSKTQYYYTWVYTKYDINGNAGTAIHPYETNGYAYATCSGPEGVEGVSQLSRFKNNMDAAKKVLETKIANLEKIITYYNSCTVSVENQISDINNTKSVSKTWKNDMKYDPIVTFDYYENYPTSGNFIKDNEQTKEVARYYVNDPGNDYDVNNNKGTTNLTYRSDIWFVQCNDRECHHDTSFKLAAPLWMKIEKEISATFNSPVNYSTYTPYGTIRAQNGNGQNWLELESNSKPVELIRETGVYPFKFTYSNIGMNSQNCQLGRLVSTSSTKSVLTEYNKLNDEDKCNAKGSDSKQTMTQEVGYVCHYIVNCPQCKFKCKDGKCEIESEEPVCDDDRCQFKCKNCIFSPSNSYTFRTVSLTNMFPNKRTTDTNWSITPNETKAKLTLERIQSSKTNDSGEEVYNTPQYSYTLTPGNMAKIREFNNEVGSYLNTKMPNGDDVLNCENSGDTVSVRCTSAFLDMLDKDKSYATVNKRVTKDKNAFRLWGLKPEEIPKPGLNTGVGPAWYIEDGD